MGNSAYLANVGANTRADLPSRQKLTRHVCPGTGASVPSSEKRIATSNTHTRVAFVGAPPTTSFADGPTEVPTCHAPSQAGTPCFES